MAGARKHLFARLAKMFHIHIWGFDYQRGSLGYIHMICRCGATKRENLE